MKEFFPFIFVINSKECCCIWYSNERDGFLIESNKVKCFSTVEQLYTYANSQNINLEEGQTVLSIDNAIRWVQQNEKEIDCVYFLDFWNAISDLAYSVGENFRGNEDNSIINSVYNKLFYGNNLPPMKPEGEIFIPDWEREELNEFTEVIKDGLRIVNVQLRALSSDS